MNHLNKALIVVIVGCATAASASTWGQYANWRFNYTISIPPGFSPVDEADNHDGGVSRSDDDRAELRVWGGYLMDDLSADVKESLAEDHRNGWRVSYQKQTPNWAVWSGAKGDRIFYERAILGCEDAGIHYRIEYPESQAKAFGPVISRLNKTLRSGRCKG